MTTGAPVLMKSVEFRRERERSWRRLESLLDRIETRGIGNLSPAELAGLPALYGLALSSLGVARSISLDRNLIQYLEALTTRAYSCVYAPRRKPLAVILDFMRSGFPVSVREHAPFVFAALLLLLLGIAVGFGLVMGDPDRYYSLMPDAVADGRHPAASTQDLLRPINAGAEQGIGDLGVFASFLFTHNTQVGILCFALGFAAGLPVFYLLLYNGILMGAMAAVYHGRGLGIEFWTWVLPHGGMELTAIALCAAGGLSIGRALAFPGRSTRLHELGRAGREASKLVAGSTALFFAAGIVEGLFRQRVHDPSARGLVAVGLGFVLFVYLFRAGRKA